MKVGWECLLSGVFLICFFGTYLKGTLFPSVEVQSDRFTVAGVWFSVYSCSWENERWLHFPHWIFQIGLFCFFFCHVSLPWWWIAPAGYQVPPQTTLSLPFLAGRGEEIQQKAHGWRKGQWRITHQLPTQAGNWYMAIKLAYWEITKMQQWILHSFCWRLLRWASKQGICSEVTSNALFSRQSSWGKCKMNASK